MKFLGKFLRHTFKFIIPDSLLKIQDKSIESVLRASVKMLDAESIQEIKQFICSKQTVQGGFADRAGKTDLYYTFFGYFVAEALDIQEVTEPLKVYLKKEIEKDLSDVHLFCMAILYARIFDKDKKRKNLSAKIKYKLLQNNDIHQDYISFLGILALFYLKEYKAVWNLIRQYKPAKEEKEVPCPVLAAKSIIHYLTGRYQPKMVEQLLTYYKGTGGFVALHRTSTEDLLSTSVALFSLKSMEADLRLIRPDCLGYIDSLYENGGFLATRYDIHPDTEYTFYGLLALGALAP